MIPIITSAYSTYTSYTGDETPKKTKQLIQEMEAKLKQLPKGKEKKQLETKLQSMKTAGKAREVRLNMTETGIHTAKAIAGQMGPISASVATFVTHNTENKIRHEKNKVLVKAEKRGGSRTFTSSKKPQETSAINEAAKTALFGFAGQIALASSFVAWGINYGKSFIFD